MMHGQKNIKVAIKYSLRYKAKHPPFNQHFIRILPDPKSHSGVHNSLTASLLSKINRCYIPINIYFGSIPVLFYSHSMFYVTFPSMVFWPEIWMDTSALIHVSQISPITSPLGFASQ